MLKNQALVGGDRLDSAWPHVFLTLYLCMYFDVLQTRLLATREQDRNLTRRHKRGFAFLRFRTLCPPGFPPATRLHFQRALKPVAVRL
jgi:hypothetical protein